METRTLNRMQRIYIDVLKSLISHDSKKNQQDVYACLSRMTELNLLIRLIAIFCIAIAMMIVFPCSML